MRDLDRVLAQCLEEIQSGRASIEDCLVRHAMRRRELEPLLRTALRIPPAPDVRPSPEFRARARAALQQEIARTGASARRRRHVLPLAGGLRPLVAAAGAALFLVVLLGGAGGVAYGSQDSLPGERLYPVKLTTERIRLLATLDSSQRAEYHLELAQRRLEEVVALANAGRPVQPEAVEAVAQYVDAALAEVRQLNADRARPALSELSEGLAQKQAALDSVREAAPTEAAPSLERAELVLHRGQLIAQELALDPQGPAAVASVRAALEEAEVKGPVLRVQPLQVGGVEVRLPPGAAVKGELSPGKEARVRGEPERGRPFQASSVEVEDDDEDDEDDEDDDGGPGESSRASAESDTAKGQDRGKALGRDRGYDEDDAPEVELRGVITRLDPLTIAGQTVTLGEDAEVRGSLAVGLIAEVEGRLRSDGSVAAYEIKVERLGKRTELQGPVTSLAPLTVGTTIVLLEAGAEVKGNLRAGSVAKVEGAFLEDGRFLASEMKVSGGPRR